MDKRTFKRGALFALMAGGVFLAASTVSAAPPASVMFQLVDQVPAEATRHLGAGRQAVSLNIDALSEMEPGQSALVDVPGLVRATEVRFDRLETTAHGSTVWYGHVEHGGRTLRTIITENDGAVVGTMQLPDGLYQVETRDGIQLLVSPDQAGRTPFVGEPGSCQAIPGALPGGESADAEPKASPMGFDPARYDNSAQIMAANRVAVGEAPRSADTTVDVLIAYNAGLVDRLGSSGVDARLDQLVAITNQAYVDSQVNLRIRNVHRLQVDYPTTGSNTTLLNTLTDNNSPFTQFESLRDQYGADLVAYLRPFDRSTHGSCGVAWIGGYNQSGFGSFSARNGYAIVSDGTDIGGSSSYCSDVTFAHELGHNMGLTHDWFVGNQDGNTGKGAYTYGNGHGIEGTFGTIMSYIRPTDSVFSNPNLNNCTGGNVCGVPAGQTYEADAVRALNNARTGIASYRDAVDPPTTTYALSVQVSGTGTVTSNPTGIDCGSTCSASFDSGTSVVLTATASSGYSFSGWSGDCAGTSSTCQLEMSAARSAQANFVAAGDPTPITDDREFVKQQYRDFLNRDPAQDPNGVDYWYNLLASGQYSRAQIVKQFFDSNEFQGNIAPVARLYFAYFGRVPDYDGLMYWVNQVSGAATGEMTGEIIGGTEAPDGAYPWQVSLMSSDYLNAGYDRDSAHFCGGSLISDQWVVTAAHCTEGQTPSAITILAGSNSLASGGQTVTVAEIHDHPNYDSNTVNNDISLLKLSEPVTASKTQSIKFVPGSQAGTLTAPGVMATVSGWGNTSTTGSEYPVNLMQVNVPVLSESDCKTNYGAQITDNMLCAGYMEGQRDSCQGDSGGPLVVQDGDAWRLAGVVSWGNGCAQPGYPGVYAKVSNYVSWAEGVSGLDLTDGGTEPQPEPSPLQKVSDAFAGSAEFQATYGQLSDGDFVNLVYQNVLGRAPDTAGYNHWLAQLAGGMTRGQLMLQFSESAEYKAVSANRVEVTMIYVGLLRRSPDQSGYEYWVNTLDSGGSSLGLIDGFITSGEYAARF
ncbi:MAG: trypsin-like serine protease [Halothiobacillaceae bacterium]